MVGYGISLGHDIQLQDISILSTKNRYADHNDSVVTEIVLSPSNMMAPT